MQTVGEFVGDWVGEGVTGARVGLLLGEEVAAVDGLIEGAALVGESKGERNILEFSMVVPGGTTERMSELLT